MDIPLSTILLMEFHRQNRELQQALRELRMQEEELARVNQEIEDTNRGVVALYAELDEKVVQLLKADSLKSRLLSNLGHELRTPLNSILALTRLLLAGTDGELTPEQSKQVQFIRSMAEDLSTLVNDQLDLAKVEAGKITVRPVPFEVRDLFMVLRGMLRPLLVNELITLSFEEASSLPPLYTDQGKVAQILRNLITNALKFTEHGAVCVSADLASTGDALVFSVTDTGIGISPEDQKRIFEEFVQLESPVQGRVQGMGLGLPMAKSLAEILGGQISVQSQVGVGSTFSVTIPLVVKKGPQESDMAAIDA
jgi:signal transduction histidine kinase